MPRRRLLLPLVQPDQTCSRKEEGPQKFVFSATCFCFRLMALCPLESSNPAHDCGGPPVELSTDCHDLLIRFPRKLQLLLCVLPHPAIFTLPRSCPFRSYAPWCGHCKRCATAVQTGDMYARGSSLCFDRLAPEYQKAAKNMNNLVNFVAVDCDDSNNRAVCVRST